MNLHDDDFTLFGVPQQFAQQPETLASRWRALQAEVHPDRFAAQGTAAQRVAMQWAVRVNEAYQRLKSPLKRATYLCELQGAAVDGNSNTAMPAAFLMQQMAWREALDEAQGLAALEQLDAEVQLEETRRFQALADLLDKDRDAQEAATEVRALMFVARLRDDLSQRLAALDDG